MTNPTTGFTKHGIWTTNNDDIQASIYPDWEYVFARLQLQTYCFVWKQREYVMRAGGVPPALMALIYWIMVDILDLCGRFTSQQLGFIKYIDFDGIHDGYGFVWKYPAW